MFVEEWEACEVAKKSINKRMKDEKWVWQTHVVMFVGKRYFVVTSLRWAIEEISRSSKVSSFQSRK